jgi:hypothetical protein
MLQPLEERAVPTAYTVNATTDTGTGSGNIGDLRYCITQSNLNAGPNTIDMTGVTGTITLTSALPSLTQDLTITGPGAGSLTLTGYTAGVRVFNQATPNLTIAGLTMTGRVSGVGAVVDQSLTNENLTINNSVLTGSSASSRGVTYNIAGGIVTINGSTVSNNTTLGGTLWMSMSGTGGGTLNVTNSQVINNFSTASGGAIGFYFGGNLNIDHSTIAGNSTSSVGGALYMWGSPAGTTTVTASTIANNTAGSTGGAFIVEAGSNVVTVNSSTFTGNKGSTAGAIVNTTSGTVTIDNSIISGNTNATSGTVTPEVTSSGGGAITSTYDAIDDQSTYTPGTGDLTAANSAPAALKLGALTAKTGPNGTFLVIPTGLGTGINHGDPAQAGPGFTDQLGNTRPQDTTGGNTSPDIGSFERIPGPDVSVDPSSPAFPNFTNVTQPSPPTPTVYQFAVVYADNVNINTATIASSNVSVVVPGGVLPVTVSLVGYNATNPHAVLTTYQFTAPGGSWGVEDDGTYSINMNAGQVSDSNGTVQAGPIGSFKVLIPKVLTVTGTGDAGTGSGLSGDLRYCITTANGDAATGVPDQIVFSNTDNGGTQTNFYDGTAHTITLGTALPSLTNPATTITGPGASVLTVNRTAGSFRIFNVAPVSSPALMTMTGMTISGGNSGTGAGINVAGGGLTLDSMVISGNSTSSSGGAIYNASTGAITITNSAIQNNTSVGGPALYNSSTGAISITASQLLNNRSTSTGSAVYNSSGQLTLIGDTIQGNSGSGTATIYSDPTGVPTQITNTLIQANTASGAMFYNAFNSPVTMTNSQILNNTSTSTGGGFYNSSGNVTLTGVTIAGNSTSSSGGGFYMSGGILSMTNTTIANNTAAASGGGIEIFTGTTYGMTVTNSSITGNLAKSTTGGGGGIYFSGATPAGGESITNTTIANNVAINGGGMQVINLNGNLNLTSDTIAGNTATSGNALPGLGGGGIELRSVTTTVGAVANVNLDNTIVSNNLAVNGFNDISAVPAASPLMTTAVTATYSAIGSLAGFKLSDLGGNITGANLLLGPVGSNGAMALLAGSPAIDAGDPVQAGTTDQLGTSRPQGSAVDMGAYERVANTLSASATVSNIVTTAAASNPTYQFTVTYADNVNINTGSIDAGDVTIGVPAGVTAPTVSVFNVNSTNPQKVIVTYQFTAPGGAWSLADAGAYSVNMNASQVTDANGSVPAGKLAGFVVAPPQTFTVISTTDTNTGSGAAGDLRYCITQANTLAAANLFSPVPSVIVFSNSTAGGAVNFYDGTAHTITLATTSALPTVTDNLTITGPGSGVLTIARSGGSFQILPISNGGGAITVNLSGMTLSGAVNTSSGAAISDTNAAALNLNDVTIKNNSTSSTGGGIYLASAGTALTLTNSTLQANTSSSTTGGGAIYFGSSGALTMTGSTIKNNLSSGSGAGVYIGTGTNSYFTITQSSIANNSAATNGGGLRLASGMSVTIDRSTLSGNTANTGQGGGMYFPGTVGGNGFKIVNSTIANNTAAGASSSGGGIAFASSMLGLVNLVSSTITGNSAGSTSTTYGTGGGGIAMLSASTATGGYSTIAMDNSIVSGNNATAANGRPDISAVQTGNVTISDYYCAIGSNAGYNPVSLGGSLANGVNLLMGSLGSNGGPTQTVPLNAGSPAVNSGDPALGAPTLPGATDQRGTARPQGPGVDMGAFERVPGVPSASAPAGGFTTVDDTNASSVNPYQFTVTYTDDTLMKYSTINGNNNAVTVTPPSGVSPVTVTFVSATPTSNAQTITATYQFTVPGGWNAADNGTWTVNMVGNQVQNTNNIYVPAGPIGTFNVAMAYTGAGSLVVTNTGDAGVGSGLSGDLRYVLTKSAAVTGTSIPNQIVFSNTTAGGNTNFYDGTQHTILVGSAFPAVPDNVVITGPGAGALTVARNSSAGAFQMFTINGPSTQTVAISGMTISGNSNSSGAAFGMTTQSLTLTDVTLKNNTASTGAGVYDSGAGTITVNNSNISSNSAADGVFYVSGTTLNVTNSTLSNNFGGYGVVMYVNGTSVINISNSTVSNNSGTGFGGVIDEFSGSSLTINNTTLSGNTAGYAGAIYFAGSAGITVTNSTIANNSATNTGGAFYLQSVAGAGAIFSGDTLTGNHGGTGGAIDIGSGILSLDSSILSGNTSANGPNIFSSTGTVYSTYNAIDSVVGFNYTAGTGDLTQANSTPAALHLQSLGNVTGPNGTFPVIALGAGSTAVDAGDPGLAGTTDQVGTTRPQGSGVDIGAFERIPGIPSAMATVSNVTISAAATAVYTFTVTYTDDVAMNYSTINGNNNAVSVTGNLIGGGTTNPTVTFVSATPTSNAASIIATYHFTAPGGQWDPSDNGSYQVIMNANQVYNTAAHAVPGGPMSNGQFTVNVPPPSATTSVASGGVHNVVQSTPPEPAVYTFTVTYADGAPIVYSTVNGNNSAITVSGALTAGGTVNPTVTFVSATPTSNASSIVATYQFTAPGGGWDQADNGNYTVSIAANQVQNVNGTYVAAGTVGTFQVGIPVFLTVVNTNDSGPGSLRDAMAQAAAGTPTPYSISFSNSTAGGAVNFYDGTLHTIALTSTASTTSVLPATVGPLSINGPGANLLTISAGGLGRLIADGSPTLTINSVKLTGGAVAGFGGAIFETAGNLTLTVNNSLISGNSSSSGGGAIYNAFGGSVNINSSTVSNNTSGGGALWMNENGTAGGALNITNSSVTNNLSTGQGGAIGYFWGGPLNIMNSSITGNSASGVGGAGYIWGNSSGGTSYATIISNSTIANNIGSTGGAFIMDTGSSPLTATNTTFFGNSATTGGAIANSGSTATITLNNCILSGNNATTGPEINSTTTVNSSYDAIDNTSGFTYVAGTGDLSQANSTTVALALQPLANQTGPNGTFAVVGLGTGSTAIDVGDPALGGGGQTDQIGTPRPQGAGVDIGAVEKVVAAPPQVSSVVVGDGTAQRSEVRSITVTFNGPVSFTGGNSNAAAAFQLLHTVYDTTTFNTQVANLQTAVTTNGSGQTVVTITFTTTGNAASEVDPNSNANTYPGGPTTPSLGDGRFTLTILASNVSGPGGALAGNGTTAGTNYVSSSTSGVNNYGDIYRLFGDATGNGIDDLSDLTAFRSTYNAGVGNPSYLAYMDYDNDGVIDLDDLSGFRSHYNHHV